MRSHMENRKMFKTIIAFILITACLPSIAISGDKFEINLECKFTGTNYEGNIISENFTEKFKYTKNKPKQNSDSELQVLSITDTKFYSQDKEYDLKFTSISNEYAVANYSTVIGSGFGRRLIVFTYIFDLKASKVDRIVTSIPKGTDEREHVTCIKVK